MTSPCLEQFGWSACGQRIETIKTGGRRKRKRRFCNPACHKTGGRRRAKGDSLTLKSVDEIRGCDHSNKTTLALSHCTICLTTFYRIKCGNFVEFWLSPPLGVKGLTVLPARLSVYARILFGSTCPKCLPRIKPAVQATLSNRWLVTS